MTTTRTWRMKLASGALGGQRALEVAVDPVGPTVRVWLVAVDGTLWAMDSAGALTSLEAPHGLRSIAVDATDIVAIDAEAQLWSRTSGTWTHRDGPSGPADPPVSVTNDGFGVYWLTTRDGRVFSTRDAAASFHPDSTEFGPHSEARAVQTCSADRPRPVRWYLDTERRIWRRDEFDPHPSPLPDVATGSVQHIAAGDDGLLWILMPRFGRMMAFTKNNLASPTATQGSEEMFMVARARRCGPGMQVRRIGVGIRHGAVHLTVGEG